MLGIIITAFCLITHCYGLPYATSHGNHNYDQNVPEYECSAEKSHQTQAAFNVSITMFLYSLFWFKQSLLMGLPGYYIIYTGYITILILDTMLCKDPYHIISYILGLFSGPQ